MAKITVEKDGVTVVYTGKVTLLTEHYESVDVGTLCDPSENRMLTGNGHLHIEMYVTSFPSDFDDKKRAGKVT